MITESDILKQWSAEKRHYHAWGAFVIRAITEGLISQIGSTELFLRLPVQYRLKEDASLVQKALYRGKGYANPYDGVEDKVGARFVVLTSDQISIVEDAIVNFGDKFWFWEKARDFVEERALKPWEFGYQSVHYVVRAKAGLNFEGEPIHLDIPCEIQIRTLLQHAFSEVTHDTIYKPSVKSTPEMMRAAAKAMALIEATDDYFRHVGSLINASVKEARDLTKALSDFYYTKIGALPITSHLDGEILDAYLPLASETRADDIISWVNSKPFIIKRISARRDNQSIFAISSILLIYFVVGNFPNIATLPNILTYDEILQIYSDLGLSMPM